LKEGDEFVDGRRVFHLSRSRLDGECARVHFLISDDDEVGDFLYLCRADAFAEAVVGVDFRANARAKDFLKDRVDSNSLHKHLTGRNQVQVDAKDLKSVQLIAAILHMHKSVDKLVADKEGLVADLKVVVFQIHLISEDNFQQKVSQREILKNVLMGYGMKQSKGIQTYALKIVQTLINLLNNQQKQQNNLKQHEGE